MVISLVRKGIVIVITMLLMIIKSRLNFSLSSALALPHFRRAKSANEEVKNKWPYGIFEQWQKRRLIQGCKVVSLRRRFANVQFANNRSHFANVFGSFAIVLFVVRACDLCLKTADRLGRIRFHLAEVWISF